MNPEDQNFRKALFISERVLVFSEPSQNRLKVKYVRNNSRFINQLNFRIYTCVYMYVFVYDFYEQNPEQMTLTVLPVNSDSVVMFCLQSYQGLIIDRSLY